MYKNMIYIRKTLKFVSKQGQFRPLFYSMVLLTEDRTVKWSVKVQVEKSESQEF